MATSKKRSIKTKSQFKTDLKKVKNDKKKMDRLLHFVDTYLTDSEAEIPDEYKPHPLKGNWKPAWECHLFPDFLLVWWINEKEGIVELIRCGSHSELFC